MNQLITLRPARSEDASAIARVHVDAWRTTYREILPAEFLAALSYERREEMWTDVLSPQSSAIVIVAETEAGEIVGFASGGAERENNPLYKGEIYAIYLLEAAQRQGIGKQLFVTLAARLAEQGMITILLWVAAENPARKFYEAMGGQKLKEKTEAVGGVDLVEVAYGWQTTNWRDHENSGRTGSFTQ